MFEKSDKELNSVPNRYNWYKPNMPYIIHYSEYFIFFPWLLIDKNNDVSVVTRDNTFL